MPDLLQRFTEETLSYLTDSMQALKGFEGEIPWLYLDSLGFVTGGVGFMFPAASDACKLPWTKGDRAATPEEITDEFNRVHGLQKGMAPKFYRGSLTLPDAAIDAELLRRLTIVDRELPSLFPKYAALGDSWKLGLLDLAFNMGMHGLQTKFPHFTLAVNQGNAQAAEAQCVRPQVGLRRNAWTQGCFTLIS
jgi:GH24 family phage-related lysozyme (muramidase)